MTKKIGLCGIVLALQGLSGFAQSVPELISYQGVLSGATGQPLTNSMVKLAVSMYTAPTGTNNVWGPQTFPTVVLQQGRFNSILGPTDDRGRSISTAFTNTHCYIGLTVAEPNGDLAQSTELAPRQRLLTTPYAFQSKTLAGRDWSSILVSGNDPAASQILGSKLQDNAITSAKIADGTITSVDIAANAIASAQIQDSGITSAKIQDGTITTADVASNAITSAKIADGTVATVDVADSAIISAKIADGTIVSADIADGSIQNQDIAALDANKLTNLNHLNASDGSPTNAVYVDADGNVGIGTTDPSEKLEIMGSIKLQANDGITICGQGSNTYARIFYRTDNSVCWNVGSRNDAGLDGGFSLENNPAFGTWISRLFISKNGNVGIGTTGNAYDSKLNVDGRVYLKVPRSTTTTSGIQTSYSMCITDSTNTTLAIRDIGNGVMHLSTDDSGRELRFGGGQFEESLAIKSGGNVGIGTTSPSYKLHVNGNAYSSGGWTGSDERWKKDITTLTNALDQVTKLRGVRYAWRTDEFPERNFDHEPQIGLVAQEVEPIVPEVVHTDQEGYKSVSYEKLTAVLIEAVKTQQRQIEEQHNQMNELKAEHTNKDVEIRALKTGMAELLLRLEAFERR